MTFQVKTPILKLVIELSDQVHAASAKEGKSLNRFCWALQKLVGHQLKARLSRRPVSKDILDLVRLRWSELGIDIQIRVIDTAGEVGARDELLQVVPAPVTNEATAVPRSYEPMF